MIKINNDQYWLTQQTELNPNKDFILLKNKSLSFNDTFQSANLIFQYFQKQQLPKFSNVAVLTDSNEKLFYTILGLWYSGLVPILINKSQTKNEIDEQIKIANCKFVFNPDEFSFDSSCSKTFSFSVFSPNEKALIIFTSGSSGKGKAVIHTFNSLFQSVKNSDSFINHTENDIWLASLPFYHIGGIAIFLRALICGTTICLTNSFSTKDIFSAIEKYSPTLLSLVQTMFDRIVSSSIQPWSKLRMLFLGGGPMDNKKITELIKLGWPIAKVYGSSETAAMITGISSDHIHKHPESCGLPLGDTRIKLINNNLFVKTKSLFLGYQNYANIDKSKIEDDFYDTGDIGYLENNHLIINSRRTDLIITGGKNVDPIEIEQVIKLNFDIVDVKVFSIKDKEWGEIVTAAIIRKKGINIESTEITKRLKSSISNYKIPKIIIFIDDFPYNSIGKIDLLKLKNMAKSSE